MMHRVRDLSLEQRLAVESLLGHTVSEDESVSVKSLPLSAVTPSRLTGKQREAAVEALGRYFARMDAKPRPVTDAEEESIFTEAMRSTRPNFRPVD